MKRLLFLGIMSAVLNVGCAHDAATDVVHQDRLDSVFLARTDVVRLELDDETSPLMQCTFYDGSGYYYFYNRITGYIEHFHIDSTVKSPVRIKTPVAPWSMNVVSPDSVYILDLMNRHTITLIDREGSELAVYGIDADSDIMPGAQGQPYVTQDGLLYSSSTTGEFVNLTTCIYDQYRNEILLLDLYNKVIRLDADGNFKEEIKNGEISVSGYILPLGENIYAASGISDFNREFSITILDSCFNPVSRMMPLFNDAQHPTEGLTRVEGMDIYNGRVMYQPFGEYAYYAIDSISYEPYLRLDFGRYAEPAEVRAYVDDERKSNLFQMEYYGICGRYFLLQYLHQKGMCWYYDIYDMTDGSRVSHFRYGLEEYGSSVEEGFILRFDGHRYGILPQYIKDNVLYWSRFNDDGTTTLFTIYLK